MERRLPLQRMVRLALFSVALAVGADASLILAGEGQDQATFSEHFASYDIPAQAHVRTDGAVDLAEVEAPVETTDPASTQPLGEGTASYYGRRFNGRRTASGEAFDMHAMTAAHRTLPFGTMVRVTNLANDRSVVVRINDRGPVSRSRLIDLSRAAAEEIGLISRGHGTVRLELIES